MAKTEIEFPDIKTTSIDKEHIKIQLDYHKENNKLNFAFKEKLLEVLLSPAFLAFIVTMCVTTSGFVYMKVSGTDKSDIIEYWKLILPLITTYIGYAIGKTGSSK